MLAARVAARRIAFPIHVRGLASSLLSKQRVNDSWTLTQLKDEAKARGLTSSGGKAAVLARLQADDVARATGSHFSTSAANQARPKSSASSSASESTPVASTVSPVETPKPSGEVPAGPSETPVVNHAAADPVINKTDEAGKASARQPFQSKRTVYNPSKNSFPGATDDNRFQPRRSAPLDVRMPEFLDVPEEPTIIPSLPTYDADATPPANTLTSSPAPPPQVVTVSHIDTHLAAPSHPSNDVVVNPPVQVAEYPIPGRPDIRNSSGSGESSSSGGDGKPLTEEERRGLYVLGGIFVGGWLLGGFGKPSKAKQSHAHHHEKVKH